jgi:peptidoglycan/LPS O-acetylase OafA/YrhL
MAIRDAAVRRWLWTHPRVLRWSLLVFMLSMAFVLSLGCGAYNSFDMMFLGYTWLAGGALVLLLAGVLKSSPRLSGWLRAPWLGRLGKISYGVYLYHQLVLGLCHRMLRHQFPQIATIADGMVTLLALGLTLVLAEWSWKYLERGFIDRAHSVRYDRKHSIALVRSWVVERCHRIARASRR